MARYFQQNLGFLRDFGHQTWFGPRTHATSNGLRKTLAETLGWRSSCIVWMTCPSWIVTIVDFDDFRPTQFLDFFLFFPMYSYIFFEIMDDIIYIFQLLGSQVHAPALWRAAGNWQQEHWSLEADEEFLNLQMIFELMNVFFSFGKSIGDTFYLLLTPLNIFKEHLTDFPSWMMMMMIKLDFHILLRLAKTC